MKNIAISKIILVLASICACFTPSLTYAKNHHGKAKKAIDEAADHLKGAVDSTAEGIAKAQEYLANYPWKGIIQERATSGVATLSDLKMNGEYRVVVLSPGQLVDGRVRCALDRSQCPTLAIYRIVLGFPGIGPQTSFSKVIADESDERFYFVAPASPGIYELRFRAVEKVTESGAFEHWVDEQGAEPDASTTMGIVIVK